MASHKLIGLGAGLVLLGTQIGAANAISLQVGTSKLNFDNYDAGTLYLPDDFNANQVICTSIGDCNTEADGPAPGAFGPDEDTWGIFSISSISNTLTGQDTFNRGDNGEYLNGIFYGLSDAYVEYTASTGDITALAQGGKLDIYLNSQPWDPDPNGDANGPGARIGEDGYTGITDVGGSLWLSLEFKPDVTSNASLAGSTYRSTFSLNSVAGSGQGYLDVTGGSAAALFTTGTIVDPTGEFHDALLDVTFNDQNGVASNIGWTVISTGALTTEVPEPATALLFGAGLGLIGWTRRRSGRSATASAPAN
jgi:hypothetical protein